MKRPKGFAKKYGQVFLKDRSVAEFEVGQIHSDAIRILEIGAGTGFLTRSLLEHGFKVDAIEPDHVLSSILFSDLKGWVDNGSLSIITKSFLDIESGNYDAIVGNIPYVLSSKIIFHIFEFSFRESLLMVQKEFADKVCASPGSRDASRISYSVRLYSEVQYLRTIPRMMFTPVPAVDSALIRFTPTRRDHVDFELAERLLRKIFSARRKRLSSIFPGIPDSYALKRGEELTMDEFLELCSVLKD